jgi:hypothetical protein
MPTTFIEYARILRNLPQAVRIQVERQTRTDPDREIVYRDLFLRDLAKVGISDEFHPVGSAANHGLLYLIARCMLELPISNVLEFGAGQTSILLDRLTARLGRPCRVTTIEHDPYWAREIAARVSHPVIRTPLCASGFYDVMDLEDFDGPAPDLVVVDGPPAGTRATRGCRVGAASYLARALGNRFVVIFDDAERAGESRAVNAFRHLMTDRGDRLYEGSVRAAKQQHVFCTDAFRAAGFF